jgi:ethanolamine ammonia-lyase small subunit
MISDDRWRRLSELTPARIALGRTGSGLPTRESMKFALAHAQARDAVHTPLDSAALVAGLESLGLAHVEVSSRAVSRHSYLLRPDLGRRLDAASHDAIVAQRASGGVDIALVIADGLSARAVHAHALGTIQALLAHIRRHNWSLGPVVVATEGRVAIGDEIGALLGARLALVMIGERPGLSSPDSLGVYLTFDPRLNRTDAERNCISNVRPEGLSFSQAARQIAAWLEQSSRAGCSGVALRFDASAPLLASSSEQADNTRDKCDTR